MSDVSTERVSGGIFARTSSGLVRTISTFDTFYYCLVQLAVSFVMFNVAFWVFYPGSQMEIATIVALVAAIFEGLTYGLFSAIYPRSGGEYVPLSRATHPLIGFIASFSQTWWQAFSFGQVSSFAATLGIAPLFTTLGLQLHNQGLVNLGFWFDSPLGWFVLGAIMVGIFTYQLYRGMATYFRVQKWLFTAAIIGYVIFLVVMLLGATGTLDFQANYNKYVGSGAYQQLIDNATADGVNLDPQFSLRMTLFFTIWPAFSFLFAVLSTAFSGEIKNVSRGQLIAIPLAQAFGGLLVLLTGWLGRLAISKQGLLAVGWVSTVTPDKFPLPYPWLNGLVSIMADNILLTIIINLSVTVLTVYVAASTAIYATRGFLAWGIDGMAPSWAGQVSDRTHSPANAVLTIGVVGIIWLAIYSFTDWFRAVAVLVPMGLVFLVTTFVAGIFPYIKREVYETSPARIEIAGIPLMTITGMIGSVLMGFIVYRAFVDADYGAFTPQSLAWWIIVFAIAIIWYFVARAVRRRQGVDMDARFEEIPIE
jgi:amino acid transporter